MGWMELGSDRVPDPHDPAPGTLLVGSAASIPSTCLLDRSLGFAMENPRNTACEPRSWRFCLPPAAFGHIFSLLQRRAVKWRNACLFTIL